MLLEEQVMAEIKQIPSDKLLDVYQLIHYFRLGLLHEQQSQPEINQLYALRGTKMEYLQPTEPVALNDWESLA
jgi:hypothetical protein